MFLKQLESFGLIFAGKTRSLRLPILSWKRALRTPSQDFWDSKSLSTARRHGVVMSCAKDLMVAMVVLNKGHPIERMAVSDNGLSSSMGDLIGKMKIHHHGNHGILGYPRRHIQQIPTQKKTNTTFRSDVAVSSHSQ